MSAMCPERGRTSANLALKTFLATSSARAWTSSMNLGPGRTCPAVYRLQSRSSASPRFGAAEVLGGYHVETLAEAPLSCCLTAFSSLSDTDMTKFAFKAPR